MGNPFDYLASAAGKVVADAWTAAMLGFWNAGLWLLKLVLTIVDAYTTPDLSETGPARALYQVTFWVAISLMVILTLAQVGIAAFRRDGRSVAQILVGTAQFLMVWVAWVGYGVAVIAACGGLTKSLMESLLHIDNWAQFSAFGPRVSTQDIVDGTVATVLGVMGIFMVFAAVGHLLVMLTRAGAMMVLSATTPISAAGLASDVGKSWFWKSFRWFHAAALTPVLMILVLGIGVQLTSGVATGLTDSVEKSIGTAVPGVILICIGCFSPLALFKLLAFTDPGTTSGAAMRAGMQSQGGISGLLRGKGGAGDSTSSAASTTDEHGRSQGETAGEDTTSTRFGQGAQGGSSSAAGAGGSGGGGAAKGAGGGFAAGAAGAFVAGLGVMQSLGTRGAVIGADLTNQMGVGHNNYVPDFSSNKRDTNSKDQGREDDNPEINGADNSDSSGSGGDSGGGGSPAIGTGGAGSASASHSPKTTPIPTGGGAPGSAGGGGGPNGGPGGAGGAGAAGGGAAGAGAASAVPV